jgi:hypothetical protein
MRAITAATLLLLAAGFASARPHRGDYAKEYEHEWHGRGNWNDKPHFTSDDDRNWEQMRAKWRNKRRQHFPASRADLNKQPVIGILA